MMLDSLSCDRVSSTSEAPWQQRSPVPAPRLAPLAPRGGKSVLVAFSERETRYGLSELVTRHTGAAATECVSVGQCRDLLAEQRVNALLLDMQLPGTPVPEFCAELRSLRFRPPILVFGQCGEDGTAIAALDSGATDYLCLPFKPMVFLARLRAHLRHHDDSDFVVYKVGRYDFRPGDRWFLERDSGRKLRLTAIETRIIRHLLQQAGAVADREDLMMALWGDVSPRTSHAIDSHVYRIRQKVELDPKAPELLVTEGKAYRLAI